MSFCDVETNIGNWIAFQFVYEWDNVRRDHIYRNNICQTLKRQKRKNRKRRTATENKTVMR